MRARAASGSGSEESQRVCVVLSTFDSEEDAVRVGRTLVERRLVACVNVTGGVRSIYWWEGKVDDAAEVLAVMKTRRDRLPELLPELAALHPYDVPEILVLPVVTGDAGYLEWVEREARTGGEAGG
jgi:periplasmic divalent cation tolerance protein